MPLGSNKLSLNKNKIAGGGGGRAIVVDLTESFSGNTAVLPTAETFPDYWRIYAPITTDADTMTYSIATSVPNATVRYVISGDGIQASDFTDNTLASNVTLDNNGNASIVKTITTTTGSGHKTFNLKITRPTNEDSVFAQSANVNLYEMVPWDISGGDTVVTSPYIGGYNTGNPNVPPNGDATYVGGSRMHTFSTPGTSTLTINGYGNLEGNVNLWTRMYHTEDADNPPDPGSLPAGQKYLSAFWKDNDLAGYSTTVDNWDNLISLVIGGGGATQVGGGGSGEMGILHYPRANVSEGTYTVTVGAGSTGAGIGGNSTIFAGNASLSKTAWGGGDGGDGSGNAGRPGRSGEDGGSGGGEAHGGSYRGSSIINQDLSDLANKLSMWPPAPPGSYKQYVFGANGNNGGGNANQNEGDGGGGANGGGGEAMGSPNYNLYGNLTRAAGRGIGGGGMQLMQGILSSGAGQGTTWGQQWIYNYSPVFTGASTTLEVAGGGGGQNAGPAGLGSTGFGGGTSQDGVVTILYPYIPAFRFITKENLT